jgi:holo-[acyl-carrier protein] synthase
MNNMTFYKANRLILGHGVDIVDINDFKRLLSEPLKQFLNRTFTESEMTSSGVGENQIHKLAGRFAVKEAILKTLGIGWGDAVAFTDVEVITLKTGAPTVRLHRKLSEIESQRGIVSWLVSTSHTSSTALASVIACGELA